ncbi:PREDICTED: lysophospholipid acyltransferase 7-like [Priapulus caudatus]|uniref:Lysophospholipid acyltransferase 7 n=1 Tax=Priapulus caudatus TaxID=37621 RepID=A0ABM1DRD3_PRICU|nr:PREDICTED: lysophospholipid acyltransferase 7-like [Priapulus caudatus]
MTPEDFLYALLLIISVVIGYYIKPIKDARKKQWALAVSGVLLISGIVRVHLLHSIITVAGNCALIKASRRICHITCFIWCFAYLAFFRCTEYFGLPKVPPLANAVQLILTLKSIGLAFEIVDTDHNKKSIKDATFDKDKKLKAKFTDINPSSLDIVLYSYCILGIFTGPFYKYRVYHDMLHAKYLENFDPLKYMGKRIKALPLYVLIYLVLNETYTVQYATTDEFFARSFLYRIFYMCPMFLVFRMRMYVGWILAESSCMCAGLGAYPTVAKTRPGHGPMDYAALEEQLERTSVDDMQIDFETVHNIDAYMCESVSTVREGMRGWNMSVQYWLAFFIYKRVPVKSIRLSVTMLVSAFWHGIHPGYYLSFLTVPPTLFGEQMMDAAFRRNASAPVQRAYDWVMWFFRMRAFEYMCMGFLLLRFDRTIAYWSSIYFAQHIVIILFITVGYLVKQRTAPKTSASIASSSEIRTDSKKIE